MNLSQVATTWRDAGVSVVPILPNGTKRAAVLWGEFQTTLASPERVTQWFGNGHQYGLALVCGQISGNLEMLELEGRACGSEALTRVLAAVRAANVLDVWTELNGPRGYSEWSPSGGLHLLYRIVDHEVPGNTKIAEDEAHLCLAETRGEGGYVVVAPTSGLCHPSGESWALINGSFGHLPEITWAQRNQLHEALRVALDSRPTVERHSPQGPASSAVVIPNRVEGAGLSPFDDFEARTDWSDILVGWTQGRSYRNGARDWTRPGKDPREGISATTGRSTDGRDRLFVFSTSTLFPAQEPITKGWAYALLNHGGDGRAAARELVRQGFGEQRPRMIEPESFTVDRPAAADDPNYANNDDGNSLYLKDRVGSEFLFMIEEKRYYFWDGSAWNPDLNGHLEHEFMTMAREKLAAAVAAEDKARVKRWTVAGNRSRIDAAVRCLRDQPGMTVSTAIMNPQRHLVNVGNGVLDLDSGRLLPHDPQYKMTRTFGASYDPQATAPRFEQFMADVLPDPSMRAYVQRALGYTMLGDVDQRAMFLIHGPSGTGKSTLMEVMRYVFGDYGATAAAGAFRAQGKDSTATPDLHDLRGKRFVTTSETAEGTSFNEDLLKRLTGRDRVKSRELYQSNQEWIPECAIWLATNHPPRFNSDDDAIWRRAKMIPFLTRFEGESEVRDMARSVLAPEADGILNWLLVGLQHYMEIGLAEPDDVKESAEELRLQADSVARFLDDRASEGVLVKGPDKQMRMSDLYTMYTEWARQVGERSLGTRRVINRLSTHPDQIETVRGSGALMLHGIGRAPGASMLGTFFGLQNGRDE